MGGCVGEYIGMYEGSWLRRKLGNWLNGLVSG